MLKKRGRAGSQCTQLSNLLSRLRNKLVLHLSTVVDCLNDVDTFRATLVPPNRLNEFRSLDYCIMDESLKSATIQSLEKLFSSKRF